MGRAEGAQSKVLFSIGMPEQSFPEVDAWGSASAPSAPGSLGWDMPQALSALSITPSNELPPANDRLDIEFPSS